MEISTDHSDSLVQVLSIPFAKQWFLPIVLSPRMEVYRPEESPPGPRSRLISIWARTPGYQVTGAHSRRGTWLLIFSDSFSVVSCA